MGCYFIDEEYVCSKCITSEELSFVTEYDIYSDEEIAYYYSFAPIVCSRCDCEVAPYKEDKEGE